MPTEPVSIIDCEAFERRAIKHSLRQMFADTLVEAVLRSNQPQPSRQELEALYKTLAKD